MGGLVVVDITVSVDGYVTAPGAGPERGLGVGGEPIHTWVMEGTADDRAVLEEAYRETGAVVMGRRLFDVVDGPWGWNEEMGYGGRRDHTVQPPYFVVTHRPPERMRLTGDFTFVTEGVAAAVERAKAVAGERNVVVMGGASVCAQSVAAGVVDEIHLHLAPCLLGGGTRLFGQLPIEAGAGARPLEIVRVVESPHATHLVYRVRGSDPAGPPAG
ncbi:dihydrofolate reductase family protein [Streptomyces triticirhizae]|uniref:Dihydrofolate reductase n=1 Tax=Streptomyces triticirhizae TaxID=2483353 RepID=A0A3M2LS28_9ACTN|nr:dihydrofolate reductase family protein [Streptomyces triticirhizae]RMI40264.1 dihydrofolate reductase [Streptomyces triticirhizae]